MTSSSPPPIAPALRRLRLRPWYLVAAMVLTWFIGVRGLTNSLRVTTLLHASVVPQLEADPAAPNHAQRAADLARTQARIQLLVDHRDVAFPLYLADTLLSGLLVVASGLAMSGRKGARALAVQTIAANAALAGVDFVLLGRAMAQVDGSAAAATSAASAAHTHALWMEWSPLGLEMAILALGVVALTRPRTKSFFEAVARAAERAEEEP